MISLPNIKPLVGYVFFIGVLIGDFVITRELMEKGPLETASMVFSIIFGVVSLAMVVFMSYHLKLIGVGGTGIWQVHPFRLKGRKLGFEEITDLDWSIKDVHSYGTYRVLSIMRGESMVIAFNDLEFSNFDVLQHLLLQRVNFNPDLDKKRAAELTQARENWWVNLIVLPVIAFFLLFSIYGLNVQSPSPISLGVIGFCLVIITRLVHKTWLYRKWIADSKRNRKR